MSPTDYLAALRAELDTERAAEGFDATEYALRLALRTPWKQRTPEQTATVRAYRAGLRRRPGPRVRITL